MIRSIAGFAGLFVAVALGWKILTGVFGWVIGLILTILWWAFIGFVIYTLIKIFSPSTAAKIRDTIRGERSAA